MSSAEGSELNAFLTQSSLLLLNMSDEERVEHEMDVWQNMRDLISRVRVTLVSPSFTGEPNPIPAGDGYT